MALKNKKQRLKGAGQNEETIKVTRSDCFKYRSDIECKLFKYQSIGTHNLALIPPYCGRNIRGFRG